MRVGVVAGVVGLGLLLMNQRAAAQSDELPESKRTDEGPRGLRNNNPGNLRDFHLGWQGEAGHDEAGYLIFNEHPNYGRAYWGVRAMVKDLLDDHVHDGLRTVRAIITEYAPAADNNPTEAYIANVCRALQVQPDTSLDLLHDRAQLGAMVRAMIRVENGAQPYSDAELDPGIDAGLRSFKP